MSDICYPDGTDWSCVYNEDQIAALDPVVKGRSEALAWLTLAALTGNRVSLCPVLIRPCLAGCNRHTWDTAPVGGPSGSFSPYLSGGNWYNGCGCSTGDCSCTALCEVILPTAVGGLESVSLDGATLDPSAYRIDNGNRLIRTDGGCWPACQDMTGPAPTAYEPVVFQMDDVATATFTRQGDIVSVMVTDAVFGGWGPTDEKVPWLPLNIAPISWSTPGSGFFGINPDGTFSFGSDGFAEAGPFSYQTSSPVDPVDSTGTFLVSYYPGIAPNDVLRYAAGVLASEFYLSCSGQNCRLPSGVTSITRSGMTLEVPTASFVDGTTGIPEVDAIVRIYNPNGLKGRPRVLSPDRSRGRLQTWGS